MWHFPFRNAQQQQPSYTINCYGISEWFGIYISFCVVWRMRIIMTRWDGWRWQWNTLAKLAFVCTFLCKRHSTNCTVQTGIIHDAIFCCSFGCFLSSIISPLFNRTFCERWKRLPTTLQISSWNKRRRKKAHRAMKIKSNVRCWEIPLLDACKRFYVISKDKTIKTFIGNITSRFSMCLLSFRFDFRIVCSLWILFHFFLHAELLLLFEIQSSFFSVVYLAVCVANKL